MKKMESYMTSARFLASLSRLTDENRHTEVAKRIAKRAESAVAETHPGMAVRFGLYRNILAQLEKFAEKEGYFPFAYIRHEVWKNIDEDMKTCFGENVVRTINGAC